MKNKVSGPGDSIFKKKGFFTALYSCLGAVVVLALVISFGNFTPIPDRKTAENPPAETNELAIANADITKSYLPQQDGTLTAATPKPAVSEEPVKPAKSAGKGKKTPKAPKPTQPAPAPSAVPDVTPVVTPAVTEPAITDAPAGEPAHAQETATATSFTPYVEDHKMIWPVYGDIAMVFSQDKLVYDPTLDQYRTNDDIRIAAQEGTPVKAGAEGKVVSIDNNCVYGNYVVVDNGNGWETTYGQLMDGVLVNEGDIVKAGQVIGGVGKPSIYGVLTGNHVSFRVTKEDEPVDPRLLLADGQ